MQEVGAEEEGAAWDHCLGRLLPAHAGLCAWLQCSLLLCAPGWRRGCAQVGIIRALAECGIPVDMVGGTSIGAFMGALYSEERNYSQIRIRAKEWAEVRGLCCPQGQAPGPWSQFCRALASGLWGGRG